MGEDFSSPAAADGCRSDLRIRDMSLQSGSQDREEAVGAYFAANNFMSLAWPDMHFVQTARAGSLIFGLRVSALSQPGVGSWGACFLLGPGLINHCQARPSS